MTPFALLEEGLRKEANIGALARFGGRALRGLKGVAQAPKSIVDDVTSLGRGEGLAGASARAAERLEGLGRAGRLGHDAAVMSLPAMGVGHLLGQAMEKFQGAEGQHQRDKWREAHAARTGKDPSKMLGRNGVHPDHPLYNASQTGYKAGQDAASQDALTSAQRSLVNQVTGNEAVKSPLTGSLRAALGGTFRDNKLYQNLQGSGQ